MSPDPIGYGDGMNMYAYVGGDPVNGTDPTGFVGEDITDRIYVHQIRRDYNSWMNQFNLQQIFRDSLSAFVGGIGGTVGAGGTAEVKDSIDESLCGSGTAFSSTRSAAESLLPNGYESELQNLTNIIDRAIQLTSSHSRLINSNEVGFGRNGNNRLFQRSDIYTVIDVKRPILPGGRNRFSLTARFNHRTSLFPPGPTVPTDNDNFAAVVRPYYDSASRLRTH